MATEMTLASPQNLTTLFEASRQSIIQSVGSKEMAGRLINLAIEGVRKVPALQNCDAQDVFNKLRQTVELGLEPFTPLHHAVLLPFKNTQQNRYDCTLIIEFQGLIQLAENSGKLLNIYSNVVYENEPYDIKGNVIEHKRLPPNARGVKMIAAYTVAELKDGAVRSCWMWAEEIEKIKKASKAGSSGPWANPDFEPQMWCKTTLRRLAKTLPLSPKFVSAANLDEKEEFGFESITDTVAAAPAEKKSMADAVKSAAKPAEKKEEVKPAEGVTEVKQSPQQRLHDAIMNHAQGDIAGATKISEKVTEWAGKFLSMEEIMTCKDSRAHACLKKFEDMKTRGEI